MGRSGPIASPSSFNAAEMSFRQDQDRTSCQSSTGRLILSLHDQQQTIGSISRRPERDSREDQQISHILPQWVEAKPCYSFIHQPVRPELIISEESHHFPAFLFS